MDIKIAVVLLIFSLVIEHAVIFHVTNAYSMPTRIITII